jgi:acyl dehydratase
MGVDRSVIGQWGPTTRMPVEFGKVREFARALHDDSPCYREPERALAPPTFLMSIAHWLGDLSATRPGVRLDMRRVLHGEQEFEYLQPVRAGDVLSARSRTRDVFEKPGKRGGMMLFVVGETEFTNQHGEVVAYMRNTLIQTEGAVQG